MSPCEFTRQNLDALIDGELSADQQYIIREHVNGCQDCCAELESKRDLDRQLQSLIRLDEVGPKIEAIRRQIAERPDPMVITPDDLTEPTVQTAKASRLPRALAWLLAAAAALLLMTWLVYPDTFGWNKQLKSVESPFNAASTEGKRDIVARLVRATGEVRILAPGNDTEDEAAWSSAASAVASDLEKGCRIRTAPSALCEVETSDKSTIRLNEAGELLLHDANNIQLVRGQLWCVASPDSELQVDIEMPDLDKTAIATLSCPSLSEIQCASSGDLATCNSLSPKNLDATLRLGTDTCQVKPGETVSFDANRAVNRSQYASSATKAWQLPLLAIDQNENAELLSVVSTLLAPIGRSKAGYLNEQQIRQLGPAGAIPLLAFAASSGQAGDLELRRRALTMAAETTDATAIPLLKQLAKDPDQIIAELAKKTLDRMQNLP